MRAPRLLAPLLLALVWQPLQAADETLARMLDAESAAVVLVDNLATLIDDTQANPLVRAWTDDNVRWAFTGMRQRLGLERWERIATTEIGYSPAQLQAALDGPAALFTTINPDPEADGVLQIHIGLVARVSDGEAAEALVRHQLEQSLWRDTPDDVYELTDTEYQGETLWQRQLPPDRMEDDFTFRPGYARVGDYLVLAEPVEYLEQLVGNLLEGESENPWSEQAVNRDLLAAHPAADLLFSFNTSAIGALLSEQMTLHIPDDAEIGDSLREELQKSNERTRKLFASLELDNIDGMAGAVSLEANHSDLDVELSYTDESGLIQLLAYRPGPARLPDFLPDSLVKANSMLFDLPLFWRTAKAIGANQVQVHALTNQLQIQLGNLAKKHGRDLEQALLDGLGEEVIFGSFPVILELEQLDQPVELEGLFLAVSLDDEQAVRSVIATLAEEYGVTAESDTLDYMDTRLRVLWPKQVGDISMPNRAAYTITDGYLIFAADLPVLQQAVSRLRRPAEHTPMLADSSLGKALDELSEAASSISFYRPSPVIEGLFDQLLDYQRDQAASAGGGCKPRISLDAGALDGFIDGIVTATTKEPGRLHLRTRMLHHVED